MTHSIFNEHLLVTIQHTGAEICSIKSKHSGHEYMWQANPAQWGSFAPVLFPIIGSLKDNIYYYKGKSYTVPKHGFIRNNAHLETESIAENKLTLKYRYSEATLLTYPFKFEFHITFELSGNRLIVHHRVQNHGETEMLFSLGGHPAFSCPVTDDIAYEDYFIEFEHPETAESHALDSRGLATGATFPVLNNSNKLHLTQTLFDNDALIFKQLKSKKVSLKNSKNSQQVSVYFPDFSYLGIWAKPKAPFVCIEPWLGITDHRHHSGNFEEKEGILRLNPGAEFEAKFEIEIVEG